MSEPKRIRVKVNNIEIEVMGPEAFVTSKFEELESKYLTKTPPVQGAEQTALVGVVAQKEGDLPDTIPTFLLTKGEPKGQDLILACGEWLLLHGQEPFEPKDIAGCISKTRYTAPGNIPRDLDTLAKKGYLKEAEKSKYLISKPGLEYLSRMGKAA